jgi:hypothetical protein
LTALLLLAAVGCAGTAPSLPSVPLSTDARCLSVLEEADRAVDRAGVRNAAAFAVPGFAHLRTDRFLAALAEGKPDDSSGAVWMEWMRALDLEMRRTEIANLPEEDRSRLAAQLGTGTGPGELMAVVSACSRDLAALLGGRPGIARAVAAAAQPPSEYATWMQVAGLYPLAAIPVAVLTAKVRREFSDLFARPLEALPQRGEVVAYTPGPDVGAYDAEAAGALLAGAAADNPFGIARLDARQERRLAELFAPVLFVDEAAPYDRVGEVGWNEGRIRVDGEKPTVYHYVTHAFLGERPVTQINYAFWFPRRSGPASPLIERGHLDGLTLRVTVDDNGNPRMIDGMNTCGCYHYFIPPAEPGIQPVPRPEATDAFVPQRMPAGFPAKRLGLHVNSGWHQLLRMTAGETPGGRNRTYALRPYRELESLPKAGGDRASLFYGNGIAKDSERVESMLLFSMGVPSVGSMRQRGHHAIVFIGRAHFTDPDLFNRYFSFEKRREAESPSTPRPEKEPSP